MHQVQAYEYNGHLYKTKNDVIKATLSHFLYSQRSSDYPLKDAEAVSIIVDNKRIVMDLLNELEEC